MKTPDTTQKGAASRVCARKKNLDAQILLLYLKAAMKTLNDIRDTFRNSIPNPSGMTCAHTAHRHAHHSAYATLRAIRSAVDWT